MRLGIALSAYAVIAVVAYFTLPNRVYLESLHAYVPMSYAVILFMALLAFKSVLHRNERLERNSESVEEGRE
jgi:hypothetical protein